MKTFRSNGLQAQKSLFITVDGAVRSSLRVRCSADKGNQGEAVNIYVTSVEAAAKAACTEQRWKPTDEPLFLYANVYVKRSRRAKNEHSVRYWFAPTMPDIGSLLLTIGRRLKGIVFNDQKQLCGVMVRKKYTDDDPRLELFFGVPSDWEEIEHDLSYAEEKSAELEELEE